MNHCMYYACGGFRVGGGGGGGLMHPPLVANNLSKSLLSSRFGFVLIKSPVLDSHLELQNSGQTCVMKAFT